MSMKKWLFAIWFILAGVNSSSAQNMALEANQILLKASDLETFKAGEQPKLRLETNFSFHYPNGQEVKGGYIRELDSEEVWRDDLQFGDLRYTRVRNEKQIWTRENFDFIPIPVQELWHSLHTTTFRMAASDVVKQVHDRKINGAELRCVEFESVLGTAVQNGQICVQKDTGLVVQWWFGERITTYSDYADFAGRMRPRHIAVELVGKGIVVADVSYAAVTAFGAETFKPLADGEISEVCFTSRDPIAKEAPLPAYPHAYRSNQYKGKVIVDLKIGSDGNVLNAAIVQTVHPDIDAAALEAVKKWKFEPGICNGKPVKATSSVMVNFQ
jgi:TonB family protein